jgi:hypothetical protein
MNPSFNGFWLELGCAAQQFNGLRCLTQRGSNNA